MILHSIYFRDGSSRLISYEEERHLQYCFTRSCVSWVKKNEMNKYIFSTYVSPSSSCAKRSGMGDVSATVRTQSFDCTKVWGAVTLVFEGDGSATSPQTSANVDKPDITFEEEDAFTSTMSASSCSVASFLELSLLPCLPWRSSDRDEDLSSPESPSIGSVTQAWTEDGLFSAIERRSSSNGSNPTHSFPVVADPCRRFRLSPESIEIF